MSEVSFCAHQPALQSPDLEVVLFSVDDSNCSVEREVVSGVISALIPDKDQSVTRYELTDYFTSVGGAEKWVRQILGKPKPFVSSKGNIAEDFIAAVDRESGTQWKDGELVAYEEPIESAIAYAPSVSLKLKGFGT